LTVWLQKVWFHKPLLPGNISEEKSPAAVREPAISWVRRQTGWPVATSTTTLLGLALPWPDPASRSAAGSAELPRQHHRLAPPGSGTSLQEQPSLSLPSLS